MVAERSMPFADIKISLCINYETPDQHISSIDQNEEQNVAVSVAASDKAAASGFI
jgi:hypothetical protein